jgi:hypothetical protein
MKTLIIGAALAVSAIAPAFAQAIIIEPEVREYVVREGRSSVVYDGDIAVGTVLPGEVEIYAIDEPSIDTDYRYAVINDRRVIVEPSSRRVIEIVD